MESRDAPALSAQLVAGLARPEGPADRARAALHLLDWLGCALAGTAEPVGRALSPRPLAQAGAGTAQAAGVLGGLGSLLEMDDVHRGALLHPGPVVCAVALAQGGGDVLAAILRGYEAMIRLGRAVGPAHYARFHNTSTCGGIGAAVAAATLMGLDDRRTVWAIGHAMSLAGGLWQCRNEPVETKHLHVSEAARRGWQAAAWAAAGLAGPQFILDGPQGFFAGLAPDGDPARVLAPADGWLIHEVSFKPWPACRHTHPAIDAALALREGLAGADPVAVRVRTFRDALVFCDNPAPVTAAQARFSLQHAVAVALRDGAPSVAAFAPERHAPYAALRARVSVAQDAAITAAYPAHFGATVQADLADGRSLTATVTDAWGDPERPMTPAAVADKFHRLAAGAGVAPSLALGLEYAVLALADTADPAALFALMPQI